MLDNFHDIAMPNQLARIRIYDAGADVLELYINDDLAATAKTYDGEWMIVDVASGYVDRYNAIVEVIEHYTKGSYNKKGDDQWPKMQPSER